MIVKYIYSACIQIETKDVRILCDPWFSEGIYDGSWYHFPKISDPFNKTSILKCNYHNIKDNLKKFELVLLCTKHRQYKNLRPSRFSKRTVIMDLNNVLSKKQTIIFQKKLKLFKLGSDAQ